MSENDKFLIISLIFLISSNEFKSESGSKSVLYRIKKSLAKNYNRFVIKTKTLINEFAC